MAEQIQRSDLVVYCDEKDVQFKEIQHPDSNWKETVTIVKCQVITTIIGDMAVNAEFIADYDDMFQRCAFMRGPYVTEPSGKITVHKPEYLPPGKALMFLRKDDKGAYHVLGAKLVQDGKVFEFLQASNPGSLNTELQKHPDYIKFEAGQNYGEKELLEDVAAALKIAAEPEATPVGR